VKRKGANSRPPIPVWVVDMKAWDGPELPFQERYRQWQAARWEWLDFYGYDVFDEDEALGSYRTTGEITVTS